LVFPYFGSSVAVVGEIHSFSPLSDLFFSICALDKRLLILPVMSVFTRIRSRAAEEMKGNIVVTLLGNGGGSWRALDLLASESEALG
jgi:hypothetical protein